jgi:hypothetical protein
MEEMNMSRYQIQPYRAGGWVLVETSSGLEIVVFDEKPKAEQACLYLNGKVEKFKDKTRRRCREALG